MPRGLRALRAGPALLGGTATQPVTHRFSRAWNEWSLARQFVVAAAVVVLASMLAVGIWLSAKVEEGVSQSTAAAATLYMDAQIAPLAQELATAGEISQVNAAKLSALLNSDKIRGSVAAVKIWTPTGGIAWSTWPQLIGKTFAPTDAFKRALTGTVTAEYEGLRHEDDVLERSLDMKLLEVYAPLRERSTDRIIAVMEFYIRADSLEAELQSAFREAWLVVAGAALLIMTALSSIVGRASTTIETQKQSLRTQVQQLRRLLERNRELGDRVRQAHARSSEVGEQLLRRVGADLHDGPAQLVSLALLELDKLAPDPDLSSQRRPCASDFDAMRRVLSDAMEDIRSLSTGLVLPELDALSLQDVVLRIVGTHEQRTRGSVSVTTCGQPPPIPRALKAIVYRVVQEALNNAHKHAGNCAISVETRCQDRQIEVTVRDDGTGFDPGRRVDRIGLTGMRDRVETIGGVLHVQSRPGVGTTVRAVFDLDALNLVSEENA